MVILGAACIAIAAAGYIFTSIPVTVICIADAFAKLICGVYLLFIAKPSRFVPKSAR